MNRAVRLIAVLAVTLGVVFFGVATGLGMAPRDGFLFAVGVIVALVPEGLLPTLSLSLAMSAARMAHRGALVRRLESVETLGSTNIICTDKTGTITANQMTVSDLVLPGRRYTTTGAGYEPAGVILDSDGPPVAGDDRSEVQHLLRLPLSAAMLGSKSRMADGCAWAIRPKVRCWWPPRKGGLDERQRNGPPRGSGSFRSSPGDSE